MDMNMKASIKGVKKKKLLDDNDDDSASSSSSSSSSEDLKLKVNRKYAKTYQDRKQREELQRMRERGEEIDSEESSSEEEDEDGNLLTSAVNLQFLKTIKALRTKEDSIYDKNKRFFDEETIEEDDDEQNGRKESKPKRFKDVLREQLLEQLDEEGNPTTAENEELSKPKFAYDDQQEEIRKSFLKGVESLDGEDSEEEDDDWMVVRNRQSAPTNDDNEVMEEFTEIEKISSARPSKDKIVDPRGEIEDGDKYLLDFFKNKKWVDKDGDVSNDDDSLEELDRADDYEASYNFRFEQAEAEAAVSGAGLSGQTYARGNTVNTVRRMDTTRKEKRQSRKERKAAERKAKEEQLKRLKNAKREETNRKLAQIKSVLGSVDQEAVDEVAIMKMLEGDYDPEQFEKAMSEAYGDKFYENEDQEWKTDLDVREELKADENAEGVIGQDDLEGGMYDTYDGDEQEDENVDASGADDEDGNEWEEEGLNETEEKGAEEETELERKVKTKMQEELYKLDYEDIVAGMPTRFKYRQVAPNDYGLSAHEILLARDTSLKQFVSLKKMAPYNEAGEYFADSKKRRRFREALKQDLTEQEEIERAATGEATKDQEEIANDGEGTEEPKKKKRRRLKKGKKKAKGPEAEASHEAVNKSKESPREEFKASSSMVDSSEPKKRRRKKKGKKEMAPPSNSCDEANVDKDTITLESDEAASNVKQGVSSHATENKKRQKKKKRKKEVLGLPASRLSSYGL
eukprot:scaffold22660_cov127-Cylindrotheca_fusiformis.AAC.10